MTTASKKDQKERRKDDVLELELELALAGHHRDVVDEVHDRAGSDGHRGVCNFQSVSGLETEDRENKCNLSLSQEQINNNNHGNAKVAKQLNQNKCMEKPFGNTKENYE